MTLYTVRSILVLDAEGKRICSRYYTPEYPTLKDQLNFENNIFSKTHRTNAEILMWDNLVTVYRNISDIFIYVTGSCDENELILLSVLNTLCDSLGKMLRNQLDKRTILENLDFVLLTLDELIDKGIILESESSVIESKVVMKGLDGDIPLAEQTISQAFQLAKERLLKN